jgi:hypothetical protein
VYPADETVVRVEAIPDGMAGNILDGPAYRRLRTLLTVSPIFLCLCFGTIVFGLKLLRADREEGSSTRSNRGLGLVIGAGTVAIALGAAAPRNFWLRRIARRAVRTRQDSVVDTDGVDVLFVEIVPRAVWEDKSLDENATDVGFLRIDQEKRRVLFEGDNMRYQIPAGAILDCAQDSYTRLGISKNGNYLIYHHFCVVTVRTGENVRAEIPFRIRKGIPRRNDSRAREENYQLYRKIRGLMKNLPPPRIG